jgi:hypothetical protein
MHLTKTVVGVQHVRDVTHWDVRVLRHDDFVEPGYLSLPVILRGSTLYDLSGLNVPWWIILLASLITCGVIYRCVQFGRKKGFEVVTTEEL